MAFQLYSIFIIPLVLSLTLTPFVIRFANSIGAIDPPNERKIHKYPIPRLGGIVIYISFFLSLLLYIYLEPILHPFSSMHPKVGVMLVVSLTMVLILGVWDDIKPLTPGRKFLGQFLAAAIVYFAGFRISSITHPFSSDLLYLGIFDFPATILWIVGITNAFNLIDGLDGLASGVAFIVALTISTISFLKGDITTAMMALLLAGAVLGFLRYNFNRAKIFLGDSGSLFIGFSLAILSMQSSTKGSAAFSIIVPVLALGLPIMDTLLSMARRFLRSIIPDKSDSKSFYAKMLTLFLPDRGHIHHQLIARGLSHRKVVLILYVVSCLFGIGAFAVTLTNNLGNVPILIAIGIATFIGVSQLRYKEMGVLRSGVLLPLYEWPLFKSNVFQGFLDLAFIVAAFFTSYILTFKSQVATKFDDSFLEALTLICGIQMGVFYITGLYKGTFRQFGMGDFLKILKTTTLSILSTWIILAFLPKAGNIVKVELMILDFYFLLTLVLGARISFHVLNYLSQREQSNGKKKVLIYGADENGMAIIQRILNDESLDLCPIGFLDENPHLEGKRLNGYPIFGGHWKLPRLISKMKIDELLISGNSIPPQIVKRLRELSRTQGISIRRSSIHFEEYQIERKKTKPVQERVVFVGK